MLSSGGEDEEGMPARGPGCGEEALRRYASRAACLGAAFHFLAYYEEDTGREASVLIEWGETGCTVKVLDEAGCSAESVELASRALPRLLGAPGLAARVACGGPGAGEGLRYRGLASLIVEGFRRDVLPCLQGLASTGREYFYVAGWNGVYALGPGEERSVTLPLLPAVVFAHTHPGASCLPSGKDLRSFADFFSSGGLAEFIVSTGCASAFYLVEPLPEDDYWLLQDAARCVSSAEQRRDELAYQECLQRLNRARGLVAALL